MPDNDSISYFSTLGSPQTRHVRVAPTVAVELPSLPAANTVNATSESDIDPNADTSGKALRADTFTLSKQAESLSTDDLRLIQKLAQRDRQVRAHEAAHLGAAGSYARSGASFSFQRGPNGVNYAIGGEVSLDTSTPDDPQAALAKAETIRRAALAPIDPSAQDRVVAGQAAQMAVQARAAIVSERAEEAAEALDRKDADEAQTADESGGVTGSETTRQASNESESVEGITTSQQTPGEIQEYLNNSSVENTAANESRLPLLNALA